MPSEDESTGIEDEKGENHGSPEYDEITVGRISIATLSIGEIKKSASESDNSGTEENHRPKRKWSWLGFWIFLTAGGTITLSIFASLAWSEAIKGTKIARSQLIFSQRAIVFFPSLRLIPYPPEKPEVWGAAITISNSGNTPARTMQIRFDCPDRPKNDRGKRDPFALSQWRGAGVKPPMFLGPRYKTELQACNIKIDTIEAAKRGEIDIFVIAKARYVDAFSNPRLTQMTRVVHFDSTGRHAFGFDGNHNCTDEDCPDQANQSGSQQQ